MVPVSLYQGSPAGWDDFAVRQAGYTHFHRWGWRAVIERVFGHDCISLACTGDDGTLRGVLPLVRVKSLLFGHYLVSMPFLNYGGPLGDEEAVRALTDHAVAMARSGGARLLELRSRLPLPVDLPVSHRKITVVLGIPGDAESLWKQLPSKLRSQVRRPQKEGVEVRFGADQVAPFHRVFARHMRDLGTPALPASFFEEIARTFGDSAWFGCAWHEGQPVACGAGFAWNGEFEMTWASALAAYNRLAPNMLLYWSFMERAAAQGLGTFNFGRCTPGSGTHRFKLQWGSRDEPLHWYQHADQATAGTPSPDDGAYAWGPRIWKRLPVGVATALGPRVVKWIP